MKRIIFLFAVTVFFLGQSAFAYEKDGVCLNYYYSECMQFKYCASKTVSGCNNYETCTLEGDKYSCVLDQTANSEKIYRPKSFVDEVTTNYRRQFYTSPVVEKTKNQVFHDYYTRYPDESRSRYAPINQDNLSTIYYPPKAEPYTEDELIPKHNTWIEQEKPRMQNFSKYKYPDNWARHGGMRNRNYNYNLY